jgi:hypothetical protein
VLKSKTANWRSNQSEGGGCLYDYASHILNLIQEIIGRPVKVKGSTLKKIYSDQVEDAVYSTLILENNHDIYSISAFDLIDKSSPSKSDAYFLQRSWPWGWGTWHDRWVGVDWDILEYKEFLSDKKLQRDFNLLGSDLSQMLIRQISGELDSWSIRWTYHIYKKNDFVLYPNFSKIDNRGWDQYATNTKGSSRRYQRMLDSTAKTTFTFDDFVKVNYFDSIKLYKRFSFSTRLINKLFEYFSFSRL